MGDGRTAVIEMALASGLALVPDDRRNPRTTTTFGTGELMRAALDGGFNRIIVGLGGSATNDGGTGMAAALGARFLDASGAELPPGGAALSGLSRIDTTGLHSGLVDATIIGATDVTNPLCGDTGASAIFGPQKGATPEIVVELDQCLANLARVIASDLGVDVLHTAGSGAAGGLGAGLITFTNAELRSGIDMVCDVLDFDSHAATAESGNHRRGPRRPLHRLRQGPGGHRPPQPGVRRPYPCSWPAVWDPAMTCCMTTASTRSFPSPKNRPIWHPVSHRGRNCWSALPNGPCASTTSVKTRSTDALGTAMFTLESVPMVAPPAR